MSSRLREDYGWTERQRQVLSLISEGRTNSQIGDALGLSLPGVKWHVSEILAKLQAESREEAAEYWRRYNGVAPRFARVFRSLLPLGAAKVIGAGAAATVLGLTSVVVWVSLADSEGNGENRSDQTGPRPISGLSETPRVVQSDAVSTLPRPVSPFPEWDGRSSVIYDTTTNSVIDLGPGSTISWSPDGTRAAWVSQPGPSEDGVAKVIDVFTRKEQALGPAGLIRFIDDDQVLLVLPRSNDAFIVELATGRRSPTTLNEQPRAAAGPLELVAIEELEPRLEGGEAANKIWELRRNPSQEPVLRFTAYRAVLAGDRAVVVATQPEGGLANLFWVDVASAQAEYIATARLSTPNWPLSADSERVVWTDDFCDATPGPMRLWTRRDGLVRAFDSPTDSPEAARLWPQLTPTGLIQIGAFGGGILLDPESGDYVAVIEGTHIDWSPDFRFGAKGQYPGHGGLCL